MWLDCNEICSNSRWPSDEITMTSRIRKRCGSTNRKRSFSAVWLDLWFTPNDVLCYFAFVLVFKNFYNVFPYWDIFPEIALSIWATPPHYHHSPLTHAVHTHQNSIANVECADNQPSDLNNFITPNFQITQTHRVWMLNIHFPIIHSAAAYACHAITVRHDVIVCAFQIAKGNIYIRLYLYTKNTKNAIEANIAHKTRVLDEGCVWGLARSISAQRRPRVGRICASPHEGTACAERYITAK